MLHFPRVLECMK